MEFMHWFWRTRLGFLPLPTTASGFAIWTRDRFAQFFDAMSGYPLPVVYTVLMVVGFIVLWRRRDVALIIARPRTRDVRGSGGPTVPIPHARRAVPAPVATDRSCSGCGLDHRSPVRAQSPARSRGRCRSDRFRRSLAIALKPPPYIAEPFKPVFAYVQAHRQPGDHVYVYSNAYQAISRYGALYGMPIGTYDAGTCDENSTGPFLADVDRYRGARRLWVIGSSVPDFRPAREAIGKYLENHRCGARLVSAEIGRSAGSGERRAVRPERHHRD